MCVLLCWCVCYRVDVCLSVCYCVNVRVIVLMCVLLCVDVCVIVLMCVLLCWCVCYRVDVCVIVLMCVLLCWCVCYRVDVFVLVFKACVCRYWSRLIVAAGPCPTSLMRPAPSPDLTLSLRVGLSLHTSCARYPHSEPSTRHITGPARVRSDTDGHWHWLLKTKGTKRAVLCCPSNSLKGGRYLWNIDWEHAIVRACACVRMSMRAYLRLDVCVCVCVSACHGEESWGPSVFSQLVSVVIDFLQPVIKHN